MNDFLLNLYAEAIGIAVTVFLVDRFAKRREKKRWEEIVSKHYAYALEVLDEFINMNMNVKDTANIDKCIGRYNFVTCSNYNSIDYSEMVKRVMIKEVEHNNDIFQINNIERLHGLLTISLSGVFQYAEPAFLERMHEVESRLRRLILAANDKTMPLDQRNGAMYTFFWSVLLAHNWLYRNT